MHFSRSWPSNSWWQTMAGWQALSRPSAAEGGGRRTAFTGPAIQPYSATEVDGWQHELSRVSQNRAAVHDWKKMSGAGKPKLRLPASCTTNPDHCGLRTNHRFSAACAAGLSGWRAAGRADGVKQTADLLVRPAVRRGRQAAMISSDSSGQLTVDPVRARRCEQIRRSPTTCCATTAVNRQGTGALKEAQCHGGRHDTSKALTKQAADKRAELARRAPPSIRLTSTTRSPITKQLTGRCRTRSFRRRATPSIRTAHNRPEIFQGHQEHAEQAAIAEVTAAMRSGNRRTLGALLPYLAGSAAPR